MLLEVRIAAILLVAMATMVAGCGSHTGLRTSTGLTVSVVCVGDGCKKLRSGSGVIAEALLRKGLSRDHTRYALLLDKWLADASGARPEAWESDELFPGTCSKPAVGRAYLNDQGYFPYTLATLQRTSSSIGSSMGRR
jgi:hypothetical protein